MNFCQCDIVLGTGKCFDAFDVSEIALVVIAALISSLKAEDNNYKK